ncbi:MAG: hypothetical protein Q4G08_01200 [Capnocytophaga sp.]|nr:hypothetical protein [Capnocytophaga sp.]
MNIATLTPPQFIRDTSGKDILAVIPADEYNALVEYLEDLREIEIYSKNKKEGTPLREVVERLNKKKTIKNSL